MGIRQWPVSSTRMSVAIQLATMRDVPQVAAIEISAFADPWSARAFHDALANPAVYFACAHGDAGRIVGYVVAWFAGGEGEIANIAVANDAWGQGVGGALLDAALEVGAERGAGMVFLEVRESNERARRLYQSRGFDEVGRRREYYRHPKEDAVVLRRTIQELRV